jgi:hypothetical protein
MLKPNRFESSKNYQHIQHNSELLKYCPATHGGTIAGHEQKRASIGPKSCSRRRGSHNRSRQGKVRHFFHGTEISLARRKAELEGDIAKLQKSKPSDFTYWTRWNTRLEILRMQLDEVHCLQAKIADTKSPFERKLLRGKIIADRASRPSPLDRMNQTVVEPGEEVSKKAMRAFMSGECRDPKKAGAGFLSVILNLG